MAILKDVKGIGPKSLSLLNKIGITTIDDLVTHYPFRYEYLIRSNLLEVNDMDKVIMAALKASEAEISGKIE